MKNRKMKTLVLTTLTASLAGCTSLNNHPAMDAMKSMTGKNGGKNFVEAYIEYRGPQEKWSGPSTFLLHVVAKEGEQAKISFTPGFATETPVMEMAPIHPAAPTTSGRAPASVLSMVAPAVNNAVTTPKVMTGDVARNHINQLATAIQAGDVAFEGCLVPVRVRLIRADGAVVEKQGCRSSEGWPKVASEAMGHFMENAGG